MGADLRVAYTFSGATDGTIDYLSFCNAGTGVSDCNSCTSNVLPISSAPYRTYSSTGTTYFINSGTIVNYLQQQGLSTAGTYHIGLFTRADKTNCSGSPCSSNLCMVATYDGSTLTNFTDINGNTSASVTMGTSTPANVSVGNYLNPGATPENYYNYYNSAGYIYPFVASSANGNSSSAWDFSLNSSSLPSDFGGTSFLTSSSCSGATCVASGYYTGLTGKQYPLVATSTNSGASWSYTLTSANLPNDFSNNAYLTSSSSTVSNDGNSRLYAVAGYYFNSSNNQSPLIATSTDGGTWTYASLPAVKGAYLGGISCTISYCVAGGSYIDSNNKTQPLILQRFNGGAWTQITSFNNLPSDSDFYAGSVSCFDDMACRAVGSYLSSGVQKPLYLSTNNRNDWTYTGLTLPSGGVSGSKNAITPTSYQFLTNINIGTYTDASNNQHPFISANETNATTVTMPTDFNSKQVSLSDVSCFATGTSSSSCVTVGSYTANDLVQYPLILSSTDTGTTWTSKFASTQSADISNYGNDGYFSNVNCSSATTPGTCVAFGGYFSQSATSPYTQSLLYPLIATSKDGGLNWTVTQSGTSNLPSDFFLGGLSGPSNNGLLPDELKLLSQDPTHHQAQALLVGQGRGLRRIGG